MKPLVEQDEMFPESSSSWENEEVCNFFFGILQSKSFFQTNNQTVYVPNALEGWGRTFTLVLKLRL